MRILAWVFIVLSALGFVSAANIVLRGPNRPEAPENFVGYAVGAFLLPLLMLIAGVALMDRAAKKDKANRSNQAMG